MISIIEGFTMSLSWSWSEITVSWRCSEVGVHGSCSCRIEGDNLWIVEVTIWVLLLVWRLHFAHLVGGAVSVLRWVLKRIHIHVKVFNTWWKEFNIGLRYLLYLIWILNFRDAIEYIRKEVITFWLLLLQNDSLLLWAKNFWKSLRKLSNILLNFDLKFVSSSNSFVIVE